MVLRKRSVVTLNITLKKVFIGELPKLEAALVKLWSKLLKVAVTVMTTKGVPKIIWAIIIPSIEEDKPIFAKKKKSAEPDIINGTTIGEINMLIISAL